MRCLSSPIRQRCWRFAVVAMALAAGSCNGSRERVDFSGTWGHQRVFGIDYVCPETQPDGSIRNTECASPADGVAGDPSATAPDFPRYRPELLAKVADLRDRQVQADTVLRCYPPGVPRIGPPARIVQTSNEIVFLYDDPNGSFYRIIPIDGRPRQNGTLPNLPWQCGGTRGRRHARCRDRQLHRRDMAHRQWCLPYKGSQGCRAAAPSWRDDRIPGHCGRPGDIDRAMDDATADAETFDASIGRAAPM